MDLSECDRPMVLDPLDFEVFDRRNDFEDPVKVIGFSLGAFSAIKLAASKSEAVSELILISPAAPLEIGPFLDQMAGAAVFKAAKAGSIAFALLTAVQALAAHAFPDFLLKQMFAQSCAAETALLRSPHAASVLKSGLRQALWTSAPLYRRAITEYVQPWEADLSRVQCACRIYHGALDNWVPLPMAEALHERLPVGSRFQAEEALGHYSTLIKVLPEVLHRSSAQMR